MSHFSTIKTQFKDGEVLQQVIREFFPANEFGWNLAVAEGNTLEFKNHYGLPSEQVAMRLTGKMIGSTGEVQHLIAFKLEGDGTYSIVFDHYHGRRCLRTDARAKTDQFISAKYARQTQINAIEANGWEWEERVLERDEEQETGLTLPAGTTQLRVLARATAASYL